MSTSQIAILVAVCLIAVAVACSTSDSDGDETEVPQPRTEAREALTSTSVPSALAQSTAPTPATAPASTAAPPATSAPASTSTSVPAMPDPTSTSLPAPTSAPASPSPQSAATSDASAPATVTSETEERDLKIVTLLPFDAIPAILEPEFTSAEEADSELEPQNLVLGLSINGDHRAYSIPTLSSHEIVNDTVGGKPVAVTW